MKEEEVDINRGMRGEKKKLVAQHLHLLRSLKQTPSWPAWYFAISVSTVQREVSSGC